MTPRDRLHRLAQGGCVLYIACDMARDFDPPPDVGMLQYRDKVSRGRHRFDRAGALVEAARKVGALAIINDDPQLAVAVQADGVHLGPRDASIAVARARIGPDRIIGVSCQNSLKTAEKAVKQGADYVAFGAVYPSAIKPGATRMSLNSLRRCVSVLPVPVCAIGGIHAGNIRTVAASGATFVVVSSAATDARRLCRLLAHAEKKIPT